MNRALLLLPLAAFATGCYVAPPCDQVANVYWTFTVPGLNALQSCSQAGVNSVSWLLIRFAAVMVPIVLLVNGFTQGDWLEAFLSEHMGQSRLGSAVAPNLKMQQSNAPSKFSELPKSQAFAGDFRRNIQVQIDA